MPLELVVFLSVLGQPRALRGSEELQMGAQGLGKPTASGFGSLFNPVNLIADTGWRGAQRG